MPEKKKKRGKNAGSLSEKQYRAEGEVANLEKVVEVVFWVRQGEGWGWVLLNGPGGRKNGLTKRSGERPVIPKGTRGGHRVEWGGGHAGVGGDGTTWSKKGVE